ncbi:MAG: hypothetical protein LPD71_04935 [Shewanella sp.]|nr:hypothetical protein [Shewanella sp.]MCF1430947.1 hypothetical protein [Shewanella sp.]MCF1438109.1 hypothetical protein [Shewanella sp.]MCF1458133.1 hypothetical protein [Shewanella sp.]
MTVIYTPEQITSQWRYVSNIKSREYTELTDSAMSASSMAGNWSKGNLRGSFCRLLSFSLLVKEGCLVDIEQDAFFMFCWQSQL